MCTQQINFTVQSKIYYRNIISLLLDKERVKMTCRSFASSDTYYCQENMRKYLPTSSHYFLIAHMCPTKYSRV